MNYNIVGKYIKNLDFKIPKPEIYSQLSKEISNYKINIDIKSNQIKEKIIEVEISLNLTPNREDFEKIDTKILFSTIIELSELTKNKKEIEKIILIEVPTKVYPELRNIFIFIFERSGFKEIKINETVDFEKLYENRTIQ